MFFAGVVRVDLVQAQSEGLFGFAACVKDSSVELGVLRFDLLVVLLEAPLAAALLREEVELAEADGFTDLLRLVQQLPEFC